MGSNNYTDLRKQRIFDDFLRIVDNRVLTVQEVDTSGFEESEGMRIPDDYLQEQEFVIMSFFVME